MVKFLDYLVTFLLVFLVSSGVQGVQQPQPKKSKMVPKILAETIPSELLGPDGNWTDADVTKANDLLKKHVPGMRTKSASFEIIEVPWEKATKDQVLVTGKVNFGESIKFQGRKLKFQSDQKITIALPVTDKEKLKDKKAGFNMFAEMTISSMTLGKDTLTFSVDPALGKTRWITFDMFGD